jgi:hypothetical protein
MSRFKSTTFGKISGKHGTAVAALRKDGLNILKVFRIASNPDTLGQKNQRGKFGFVVRELNCMRSVFTITFNGQYGINRAVSKAMKTALTGEYPDFNIDYSKLIISEGTLNKTPQVSLEQVEGNTVKIVWNAEKLLGRNRADNVNLVFLNQTSKSVIMKQNVALSGAGSAEVDLPLNWMDKELHSWIYFTSPIGTIYSTSQYICQFKL